MIVPTIKKDDTNKQIKMHQWRQEVTSQLFAQGLSDVGQDFRSCGCSVKVDICTTDINHSPRPILIHCGERICPDCAAHESYRLLTAYLPTLETMLDDNPKYPGYFLKHLVLTTPFNLRDLTAEQFAVHQKVVKLFFEVFYFEYFKALKRLSKGEIRRGRCDLTRHGIGGLQAAEFGEDSQYLHWHVLVYGPFMPIAKIWSVWKKVTDGKAINAKIYPLKKHKHYEVTKSDLLKAVKEIVKYSTKFIAIEPHLIPQLHRVLKGNRRFRAFGVLYNTQAKKEKKEHLCDDCNCKRETVTIGEWLTICENLKIEPDDVVTDAVDFGIALYCSRYSSAISVGNDDKQFHKARDSIDSEV